MYRSANQNNTDRADLHICRLPYNGKALTPIPSIHLYSPSADYSAGIFSKAGESRTRLRQNGLNFRPSLLRHLKYASISAILIFDGTKILLRFGSQKFVPPYFFNRRSTNLQIDCRLSKVSARQVGKYGEPNRNRFDFCLPPIKLSSKKLRILWAKKLNHKAYLNFRSQPSVAFYWLLA